MLGINDSLIGRGIGIEGESLTGPSLQSPTKAIQSLWGTALLGDIFLVFLRDLCGLLFQKVFEQKVTKKEKKSGVDTSEAEPQTYGFFGSAEA